MDKWYRPLFASFLSLTILLSGAPFRLAIQAHAQDRPSQEEASEADAAREMDEKIALLQDALLNPSGRPVDLDPFQLTAQQVIDDRSQKLEAVIEEEIRLDYEERISIIESDIQELRNYTTTIQEKIDELSESSQTDEVAENQKQEFEMMLDDVRSRLETRLLELEHLETKNPANGDPLQIMHMVDPEIIPNHYWGRDLRVIVPSTDSDAELEIRQSTFRESLSHTFSRENEVVSTDAEMEFGFELRDPRGNSLHKFARPVSSVMFYGKYLVYIETDSLARISETGTLPIRFIDLEYFKANLGNAPLPVFTLPLKTETVPERFSIENGLFKVGETNISYPQFSIVGQNQTMAFNTNVALVDSNTAANVQPLIGELIRHFGESMKQQGELFASQIESSMGGFDFVEQSVADLNARSQVPVDQIQEIMEAALSDGKISDEEYARLEQYMQVNNDLTQANESARVARKLFTRISLVWRTLIHPRPTGSRTILKSMITLAVGTPEARQRLAESGVDRVARKFMYYGVALPAILVAATQLPEPYTINLYKSLDLISATHEHFMGYLEYIKFGQGFAALSADAFRTTFEAFNPSTIPEAYFYDGRWIKLGIGVANLFYSILMVLAPIHFVVSGIRMYAKSVAYKALQAPDRSLLNAFIKVSALEFDEYKSRLSDSEREISGSDVNSMSEEDERLLADFLERSRNGRVGMEAIERDIRTGRYNTKSVIFKIKSGTGQGYTYAKRIIGQGVMLPINGTRLTVNGFRYLLSKYRRVQEEAVKNEEALKVVSEENDVSIKSFLGAMQKTFVSYVSVRGSMNVFTAFWSGFNIARVSAFNPYRWLMMLFYPQFFHVTVSRVPGKQHFPSHYNGGLQGWSRTLKGMLSSVSHNMGQAQNGLGSVLYSRAQLASLKQFEDFMAPIEELVKEIALKRAQIALIEQISDPSRMAFIFDSAQSNVDSGATTGVTNLYDPKLKALKKKERTFYQAYFTRTYDVIMQQMVKEVVLAGESNNLPQDPVQFARAIRDQQVANESFEITPPTAEQIQTLGEKVESAVNFDTIKTWAQETTNSLSRFAERTQIQLRHKILSTGLSPDQGAILRYLVVSKNRQDTRAFDRSVRASLADLIAGIPLAVITPLVMLSGVDTGVLQIFDPNGLNTDTHYMYLSRYVFYSGFVPGILMGVVSGAWMQLQFDQKVQEKGGFVKIPTISDSKRGFWRYYVKTAYKNPALKWRMFQVENLKIIYFNFLAGMLLVAPMQYYGLGRVDIGGLLSGYILAMTLPLSGFGSKIGQAYEVASMYFYDKVPQKFRAHPEAQLYINKQIQTNRVRLNYYLEAFQVIVLENFIGELVTLKDNTVWGTRAFYRFLTGGDTPTVLLSNWLDKLANTFAESPAINTMIEGVRDFFTTNYEAFERFPDRLPAPPEGVERIYPNADLPNHALGEFLGRFGAMVAVWSFITAIPYKILGWEERRTQRAIQRRGQEIRDRTTPSPESEESVVSDAIAVDGVLTCRSLF